MDTRGECRFKTVLVTGAAGFAGHYLVRELSGMGHEVACLDAVPADSAAAADLPGYRCVDLADAAAVDSAVAAVRPDAVIHLAAISFLPDAAKNPGLLWAVNIDGTMHVVEAVLRHCPQSRFVFVSSAQVYGAAAPEPYATRVAEDHPLLPLSHYAISKVAGERFVGACAALRGLDAVIVRPSNHTGPGQSPKFVAISFASQIVAASPAPGQSAKMRVGNLDSVRDFSDVRDVVRAYRLVMEKGIGGEVYNVSSGTMLSMRELLERMLSMRGVKMEIEKDEALWRPTDNCAALSTAKIERDTGWKPRFSLDETLRGIFASLAPEGAV